MLDLISSSVSCGMRPRTSRPDLGAERPDRCARRRPLRGTDRAEIIGRNPRPCKVPPSVAA